MSQVKRLSPSNFNTEVLQGSMPVIVVFLSKGEGLRGNTVRAAIRLGGANQGRLKVGVLEGELEDKFFRKYKIPSVPTTLLFKGGQVIAEHYGEAPLAKLKRMVGTAGLEAEDEEEEGEPMRKAS